MNTQIQTLTTTTLCGQTFSVYGTKEEPFFLAKEVADVLSLTNVTDMISRVDEDERSKFNLGSRQGETWFLTESGLYEVLMQSRKPIAKQFKKGVKQILKQIRTEGGYIAATQDETEEAIIERALLLAQKRIKEREQQIAQLKEQTDLQTKQLEAEAPKVLFANAIIGSKNSILIGELAKILTQNGYTIGQNKLFQLLRNDGYLGKKGERYNMPHQKYIQQGLFEIKTNIRSGNNGEMYNVQTTKVTPKGQAYFINRFLR